MSILSQLMRGKITFSQAATQAGDYAQKLTAADPALAATSAAILSAVKQGASNAIMLADTALGPMILAAGDTVEAALETALASATKGLSVPFNPIMDATIDQIAAAAKAQADAWALAAKAKLAAATPPAPATKA